MGKIKPIARGSLAKSRKLNEVIQWVNSLLNMVVREGSEGEAPKLIAGEGRIELVTTGAEGEPAPTGSANTFELDVVKDDNTAGRAEFNGEGILE